MGDIYVKSNELFESMGFEKTYDKLARPFLVADGIRNPENVGALIRLADNVGAGGVFFIRGTQPLNMARAKRAAASSVGNIAWNFVDKDELIAQLPDGYAWVAIETTQKSENLFFTKLPQRCVFFVGNESRGIRESLLERMQQTVFIPVPGPTRSLNVSHAAAVAMFEWLRQMMNP